MGRLGWDLGQPAVTDGLGSPSPAAPVEGGELMGLGSVLWDGCCPPGDAASLL